MPITFFQKEILLLLADNRNPDSYIAGGVAINLSEDSVRYSKDLDIFHDVVESVRVSSQADMDILLQAGFVVELLINQSGFVRALIKKNNDSLVLEWAQDTAFRFFPLIRNKEVGYMLNEVDLAVNKVLALANRNEVRDIIDIIYLHDKVLSLSAICWAACGKDPGFTPDLLIDLVKRHSVIRPEQLDAENLVAKFEPNELKRNWLDILKTAQEELTSYPVKDFGCIYCDAKGNVVKNPIEINFKGCSPHYGKIGGSLCVSKTTQTASSVN